MSTEWTIVPGELIYPYSNAWWYCTFYYEFVPFYLLSIDLVNIIVKTYDIFYIFKHENL